jgi:hypothetical protein
MWSLAKHQLENARLLATHDQGRPRQASLRRAVSTAYYALFQALCETCADTLVGWEKPWEAFTPVFRALDHGRTGNAILHSSLATRLDVQRLGAAFKELQAARIWADYNPEPRPDFQEGGGSPPFTRGEALKLVQAAQEAVEILDRLDQDARLRLVARLVGNTKR